MKYILIILISFSFSLISISQEFFCSKARTSPHKLKSATLKNSELQRMEKYDLTSMDMNLKVSNTNTSIEGSVTHFGHFKNDIDSILLELHPDFTIDSILLNNKKVLYIRKGNLIYTPCETNKFAISIFYHGKKNEPQDQFMGGSGVVIGTDLSTGKTVSYTLSEPFSAYEWWPSKQSLHDKIDSANLYFTTANPNLVGSNGILVDKIQLDSANTTFHWKTNYPTTYYLFSFSVGPYSDYSFKTFIPEANDSLLIQNYIYNDTNYLKDNKFNIELTGQYIQNFSTIYGVYPFIKEKYGHCVSSIGGGMEHQTMTTLNSFDPYLVSHELAHQWWGDHVTCSSYQDIWLNEGFATYSEYLTYEKLFPNQKNDLLESYQLSAKTQKKGSVWVKDTTNENRIFSRQLTYDKGGAIIHTLRSIIHNDSLFFKALSNFQAEYAYSSASVTDFKNSIEKTCKLNFTNFFNEWYYGEGYPIYSFKSETTDSTRIYINQTTTSTKTSIFTTPIELLIARFNLSDTLIRIEITKNNEVKSFPKELNFSSIKSLDPNNNIIHNTTNYLSVTDLMNDYIEIFPNPVSKSLHIYTKQPNEYLVRILDLQGKKIAEIPHLSTSTLNVENFEPGIYIIELSTNQYSHTEKLIIE
jgi:aminopeptidase N